MKKHSLITTQQRKYLLHRYQRNRLISLFGFLFLSLIQLRSQDFVTNFRYAILTNNLQTVTVRYSSQQDNAPIVLLKMQYSSDQRFQLKKESKVPGYYRIVAQNGRTDSNAKLLTVNTQESNAPTKASANGQTGPKIIQFKPFSYDPQAKYKPGPNYTHQLWKIEKVPYENETYWIKSLAFGDNRAITRIKEEDWSTIHLEPTDSNNPNQKWIIRKTDIDGNPPESLTIHDFEFHEKGKSGDLSGYLTWTDKTASETGFKIWMKKPGSSSFHPLGNKSWDKTKYNFSFKTELKGNKQYEFYVVAYNDWETKKSGTISASPKIITPKPPSAIGTQNIIVYNCHNDRKQVRLYLKDLTAGTAWQQVGYLNSEKNSSGGCNKNNPKIIPLKDGHQYILVALDCGSSNPDNTEGRCHRMTTFAILGDSDGYNSVEYVVY